MRVQAPKKAEKVTAWPTGATAREVLQLVTMASGKKVVATVVMLAKVLEETMVTAVEAPDVVATVVVVMLVMVVMVVAVTVEAAWAAARVVVEKEVAVGPLAVVATGSAGLARG